MKNKLDDNLNIIHEQERILCSAIWVDDSKEHIHQPNNIKSGFVVCGRRHHNCFRTIEMIYSDITEFKKHKSIQGFLTQTDRFVNREEAMKIAVDSKHTPTCVSIMGLIAEWVW